MLVQNNSVVSIHYTLTDNQGVVIDSSIDHTPLAYIQGLGHIVPGLEKVMNGKKVGDKFKVQVPAAEGYGLRNEELMDQVPMEAFQGVAKVEPGMEFYADGPTGPVMVTVKGIQDNMVLIDGNHPLAGMDLNFEIELMEVREATPEEMEHGHIHGEGGHQH
jgi:FKBP-type peptidyl-prolyl cis-trans isomerase SlyD